MYIRRKIRVLIVDDSFLFRETLARNLSQDNGLEVVGTASDPYSARDRILELQPDVMTLDVEMPKMNGIEFLKRLMPQYPLPVIVVSSLNKNVFDALDAGAVDFVTKPVPGDPRGLESFTSEISVKIKIASTAKVGQWKATYASNSLVNQGSFDDKRLIAIGASTGGTEAIHSVLKAFPRNMPGIVVVQHMPPVFTKMYAERLNNSCALEVKEAEDGDRVEPGRVLIAPGDYHMAVNSGSGGYFVECFKGEKVNGHCPSVDVLFNSVAEKAGRCAIGVILTGMGYDGAKGILAMKKKGALTLGQDEQSCVVYGMPKVAYDLGAISKQASLNAIPDLVMSALNH